jgi:membrane protein DedA with SNARE-associated domain
LIEILLFWLKEIGLAGLFVAMFLEGSSLPFPGIAVVLAYGFILPVDYWNTLWIAAGMSAVYCIASLIPYILGRRLEGFFYKRKGFAKAKDLFIRYGSWSVALSRPFGIGNYISYVAGASGMKMWPYFFLTFIGIYPWSYTMILLGNYFNGSYEEFQAFYQDHSVSIYSTMAMALFSISLYLFLKNRRRTVREGEVDYD